MSGMINPCDKSFRVGWRAPEALSLKRMLLVAGIDISYTNEQNYRINRSYYYQVINHGSWLAKRAVRFALPFSLDAMPVVLDAIVSLYLHALQCFLVSTWRWMTSTLTCLRRPLLLIIIATREKTRRRQQTKTLAQ